MILSSNFPFLFSPVGAFAQYSVKCGHEYDFCFWFNLYPLPISHILEVVIFLLEVFPWSLELCIRLVLFVTKFQSLVPRQREPCLVLVGSNAVVGLMTLDLLSCLWWISIKFLWWCLSRSPWLYKSFVLGTLWRCDSDLLDLLHR